MVGSKFAMSRGPGSECERKIPVTVIAAKVPEGPPSRDPSRMDNEGFIRYWLILAAIVALGAAFCTLNLYGWDSDTGQHPDERFMASVAEQLKMPVSLSEYLDSSRNPLNPRNSGNTFYVYGLLPQTLTHLTAGRTASRQISSPLLG